MRRPWLGVAAGLGLVATSIAALGLPTPAPPGSGPVDIVMSSLDTTGVTLTGRWAARGPYVLAYKGGQWLDDSGSHGGKTVVFTPRLPADGTYQVYARWITNPNHASNAKFIIASAAGPSTVTVNERQYPGKWYELGTYRFKAGDAASVTISDDGADGIVLADAVRFVKESVAVDASASTGPVRNRATGMLSSFTAEKPADALVNPLHIQMFRCGLSSWAPGAGVIAACDRMRRSAKFIQVNLSDTWGYPNAQFGWPGANGDFSQWKQHVTDTVNTVKDHGCKVQYDIWNEPNWPRSWPQDAKAPGNFYLTWQSAYQTIRANDPDADITGPCTGWDAKWMEDFLTWTRDNHCLPDVITWHQFGRSGEESAVVAANVAQLKTWMAANQINLNRFSVNEYIGPEVETNPGVAVWMFDDLERAGVESAAHAVWNEPDGLSEFHNCSLDGLLTEDLRPRSTWWAYKYYGAMSGERILLKDDAGSVHGLGSWDPEARQFRLLLGRGFGTEPGTSADSVPVTIAQLTKKGIFRNGETVLIQARRIQDSGWNAAGEPPVAFEQKLSLSAKPVAFALPDFGLSDAYSVVIAAAKAFPLSDPDAAAASQIALAAPALAHPPAPAPVAAAPVVPVAATPPVPAAPVPAAPVPAPASTAPAVDGWPFDAAHAKQLQLDAAQKLGLPVERTVTLANGVPMVFELIPAGAFVMGSPDSEPMRNGSEVQHPVRITHAFYMARDIFTQAQWCALMDVNPSLFKRDTNSPSRPVEHVSFPLIQDQLFPKLQKLAPAGWTVRFPTEAEWEYACRAGTDTEFYFGNALTTAGANYDDTAVKEGGTGTAKVGATTPVETYKPNAWGLYDMSGNVFQWCEDWYGNAYKTLPEDDPCETTPGPGRVLRGGCWIHGPKYCRSAARYFAPPEYFAGSIGLRVVLAPQ